MAALGNSDVKFQSLSWYQKTFVAYFVWMAAFIALKTDFKFVTHFSESLLSKLKT